MQSTEFVEEIYSVSSPKYIPVMESVYDGNEPKAFLDALTPRTLGQYGYEKLGEYTKLFFDIDGKGKALMDKTGEFKEHLDSLLETGERRFVYCYCLPEDMEEASKREDKRKLSFHIVFEDKPIKRVGFKTEYEEDTLKWLLGKFYDELRPCVDDKVYDENRKLRFPCFFDNLKPVALQPCDSTVNLTRFAVNLPPGIYKVITPKVEKVEKKNPSDEVKEFKQEEITEERRQDVLEMLSLIKKERFRDGNKHSGEWPLLGRLLKSHGLPKELFLQFSKESGYAQYSDDACLAWWYSPHSEGFAGFPTLHRWLDEDGVDWRKLKNSSTKGVISKMMKKIFETGELTNAHAARIFYEEKKEDIYKTQMGWLVWDDVVGWQIGTESLLLLPFINTCGDALSSYVSTLKEEEDDQKKKKALLRKVSNKMLDHGYITKTIKIMSELFKNDTIIREFDNHPELFCFTGLLAYDLVQGKMIPILKEHKILTTCGYPAFERVAEEIEEARQFVLTYQEPQALESFLSMCACSLYGKNKNQVIFIHTGLGGNGKSVHADLMMKTLGNYAGLLPIEQFTVEAKSRSEANSSLAALYGKRYARANEPEDDAGQKLKISRIKQITGDAEVDVRKLYGETFQMSICFTPSILANDIPSLSKQDGGIARRIKVVRYPYIFKEDPEEDDPYQRKKLMDINLDQYKRGFFFLCADMWKKTNGVFLENEDIKEDVEEYLRENNPLIPFLTFYEHSSDTFIRVKALHELFNDYCDKNKIERYKNKAFSSILEKSILSDGQKVKVEKDPKNGHKVFIKQTLPK